MRAAVELSERYITDRFLPDKAIDLIDEAASETKILRSKTGNSKVCVDAEDIAKIVSQWTGIPLSKIDEDECTKLTSLETELNKAVIGQEQAIAAIAKAVRRSRVGIGNTGRPIGSFLFIGESGVGKTALSKALAKQVFGSENYLITVDMSEFMEKHAVSRLIGAPPGYVGFEEGGQLTQKVRRKPYCVVLFDEIEKAHPDVFNLLLSVLDEGVLEDASGRKVNFKNTIIIMTSNLCADILHKNFSLGFGDAAPQVQREVKAALRKKFKPEFLNRIDEIIIFNALHRAQLIDITEAETRALCEKVRRKYGCILTVDTSVTEYICRMVEKENAGARPVRRAIRNAIENTLTDMMLAGEIKKGEKYTAFCENNIIKVLDSEKLLL